MTYREICAQLRRAEIDSADWDAALLIEHFCRVDHSHIPLSPDTDYPSAALEAAVAKRAARYPLQYLVGVLYQDGRAKYVCYALKAEDRNNPPEEIKNVCTFVPCSIFQEEKGFFVLFQSTATGECIKPERA